jgi:hypothetical protein
MKVPWWRIARLISDLSFGQLKGLIQIIMIVIGVRFGSFATDASMHQGPAMSAMPPGATEIYGAAMYRKLNRFDFQFCFGLSKRRTHTDSLCGRAVHSQSGSLNPLR